MRTRTPPLPGFLVSLFGFLSIVLALWQAPPALGQTPARVFLPYVPNSVPTNVWVSHAPRTGVGYVNALAVDPAMPSIVYAGTDNGVFKSVNGGTTFRSVNVGITNGSVVVLAIDPATLDRPEGERTLYACTCSAFDLPRAGAVLASTNGGASWHVLTIRPNVRVVFALAVSPTMPTTLYASTDRGAFKSMDGGATWSALTIGSSANAEVVVAFAVDPTTPATVYAASSDRGVYKSTDGGATWNVNAVGLTGSVQALAIDPTRSTTLYAGTDFSGAFKSMDGGATWYALNLGIPAKPGVVAFAVDPVTPGRLYAVTGPRVADQRGMALKSTDAGATWDPLDSLIPFDVNTLALDPQSPATIYAGTDGGGILKTSNSGVAWTSVGAGLPSSKISAVVLDGATRGTLYAGTHGGGTFQSVNGGTDWFPVNTGLGGLDVLSVVIDPASPATLYAATNCGVYKTAEHGARWVRVLNPSGSCTSSASVRLTVAPQTPTAIYAWELSEGIYRTTDGGATWTPIVIPALPDNIWAFAVDPVTPTTLYQISGYHTLHLRTSGDAGMTWNNIGPVFRESVSAFAVTPFAMYAWSSLGANDPFGMLMSVDGGEMWDLTNLPLSNTFAFDPSHPTTLYAGGAKGVFKSTDGVTWTALNNGLYSMPVDALAVDPYSPRTVYAGTPGGVYVIYQSP